MDIALRNSDLAMDVEQSEVTSEEAVQPIDLKASEIPVNDDSVDETPDDSADAGTSVVIER